MEPLDLRCPAKLHGRMVGDHSVEVKCDSRFCGAGRGVVVLHVINILDGKVTDTRRFQDPMKKRERKA